MNSNDKLFIENIKNDEKNYDILFSAIMFLGSLSFLLVGISSYLNYNVIGLLNAKQIIFFPQGLTMCFYGLCGLTTSSYQLWNLK